MLSLQLSYFRMTQISKIVSEINTYLCYRNNISLRNIVHLPYENHGIISLSVFVCTGDTYINQLIQNIDTFGKSFVK